jgi:hypothetical protein
LSYKLALPKYVNSTEVWSTGRLGGRQLCFVISAQTVLSVHFVFSALVDNILFQLTLQTMNQSLLVHTLEGEVSHIFVALICEDTVIYHNMFVMYF